MKTLHAPLQQTHKHAVAYKIVRILSRWVIVPFLFFVIYIIYTEARDIDWLKVGQILRHYGILEFFCVMALVIINYALFASYDLLAQKHTHQKAAHRVTCLISFISYAFNFNIGALIGSAGLRFKLYSRLGLAPSQITGIIGFCLLTHWLGYCLLIGILLVFDGIPLPNRFHLNPEILPWLGMVALLLPVFYAFFCLYFKKATFSIFGYRFRPPSRAILLQQLLYSCGNWLTTATILFLLIRNNVAFIPVVEIFLISSIIGAIAHIPAGFGVYEAVFIAFLGAHHSRELIIGALLAYRVCFYIIPFAVAAILLFFLQLKGFFGKPQNATS